MTDIIEYAGVSAVAAEQAVLGAILIDARCVPEVMEGIRGDDFAPGINQDTFRAIHSLFLAGETIDPVTVLEKMQESGAQPDQLRAYMLQLMDTTPTAANVGEYIKILKDHSLRRRVADAVGDLGCMLQEGVTTGADLMVEMERRLDDIRNGRAQNGLVPMAEVLIDAYDLMGALADDSKPSATVPTGLPDLDRRINGLGNSNLVILAARPGMGKTSMALGIALAAGKRSGKDVAIFSLEMSREQLALRLISQEVCLEHDKLVTGRMTEDDWTNVAVAAESLAQSRIWVDDDASNTVASIKAKCRRLPNLGLVVIDYLQLMDSSGSRKRRGENRQQEISDISRSLKIMAKELNVPVLCLSQLSRANESRMDKRPMLSDLRESGAIEQDADVVLFLYRDSYYNPETEDDGIAECIVAKNRHGGTGTVELAWFPQYTLFAGLENRYQETA